MKLSQKTIIVNGFHDASATLPVGPSSGDMWICSVSGSGWALNSVYRYDGLLWTRYEPSIGHYVSDLLSTYAYRYDGTNWVQFGGSGATGSGSLWTEVPNGIYRNGRVMVGQSWVGSDYNLQVTTAGFSSSIYMSNGNFGALYIACKDIWNIIDYDPINDGNGLAFESNNTRMVTINNDGKVGIGLETPANALLHIRRGIGAGGGASMGDANAIVEYESNTNGTNFWFRIPPVASGGNNATIGFATGTTPQHGICYNAPNDRLVLTNNSWSGNPTDGVIVDTASQVGINQVPGYNFHVHSEIGVGSTLAIQDDGGNNQIKFGDLDGSARDVLIYSDNHYIDLQVIGSRVARFSSTSIHLSTSGIERLNLLSNGELHWMDSGYVNAYFNIDDPSSPYTGDPSLAGIFLDSANDITLLMGTQVRVAQVLNIANNYSFPMADGLSSQCLITDGAGTLNWGSPSGGGGVSLWTQSGASCIHPTNASHYVGIGATGNMPGRPLSVFGTGGYAGAVYLNGTAPRLEWHMPSNPSGRQCWDWVPYTNAMHLRSLTDNFTAIKYGYLHLFDDGTDVYTEVNETNADMDFIVNGTLVNLIYGDGGTNRVGIGKVPTVKFDVSGIIATNESLRIIDTVSNNYNEFKSSGISSSETYVLPSHDGSNGNVLTTDGNGYLSWENPVTAEAWVSGGAFTRNSDGRFTVANTSINQSIYKKGRPIKYRQASGTWRYGLVTNYATGSVWLAGHPMTISDDDDLCYSFMNMIQVLSFAINGTFADNHSNDLLEDDLNTYFRWDLGDAYLAKISHIITTNDTSGSIYNPYVNVSIGDKSSTMASVCTTNISKGRQTSISWVNTDIDISSGSYKINYGDDIEVTTDYHPSGINDASNLTIQMYFVLEN